MEQSPSKPQYHKSLFYCVMLCLDAILVTPHAQSASPTMIRSKSAMFDCQFDLIIVRNIIVIPYKFEMTIDWSSAMM